MGPIEFWGIKKLGKKNSLGQKNFDPKKILGPKNKLGQKKILGLNSCSPRFCSEGDCFDNSVSWEDGGGGKGKGQEQG